MGFSVDEIVLGIDLAPTFLDIGGVATPAHMDGRSILPLLLSRQRNLRDKWPDTFLIESSGRRETPEQIAEARAKAAALRYSAEANASGGINTHQPDKETNGTLATTSASAMSPPLDSLEEDETDDDGNFLDDVKDIKHKIKYFEFYKMVWFLPRTSNLKRFTTLKMNTWKMFNAKLVPLRMDCSKLDHQIRVSS